ncbi:MAG: RNA polymerase sigma factor [Planctomycetota bacterium]|jgi:RNA polymerase sigma-70 factor (ECF subfamily)
MLEDRLLVWKLKRGQTGVLEVIYEKYKNDLLALAIVLSNNRATAEDVVHDVFVSFAEFAGRLRLRGSLRSYLLTCVANRVRNLGKAKHRQSLQLTEAETITSDEQTPAESATSSENKQRIRSALARLPYEQREVIILHLMSDMRFRAIAEAQGISISTVQSRYRYGLGKLRTLLDSEMEK